MKLSSSVGDNHDALTPSSIRVVHHNSPFLIPSHLVQSDTSSSSSSSSSLLPSPSTTALILLNAPLVAGPQDRRPSPLLEHLWSISDGYRVCADGGANRLHDTSSRDQLIPHLITGDLDSIRPDVRDYYQSRGVDIVCDPDQDSNDLDKALRAVLTKAAAATTKASAVTQPASSSIHSNSNGGEGVVMAHQQDAQDTKFRCYVYGAFGGRFDQEMACLQALYRWSDQFESLWLYDDHTMAFLLSGNDGGDGGGGGTDDHDIPNSHSTTAMEHHIRLALDGPIGEGRTCGLIPLSRPCRSLTTWGLQWNLHHQRTEFGGLVSTSNRILDRHENDDGYNNNNDNNNSDNQESPVVVVMASDPIIFTAEVRPGNSNAWTSQPDDIRPSR